jgi:hypothetical protein
MSHFSVAFSLCFSFFSCQQKASGEREQNNGGLCGCKGIVESITEALV